MPPPLPQSICDRARLLATIHPLATVAAIMGKHASQISKMKKRGWMAAKGNLPMPMPSDFAIQSRVLSHDQMVAHYGVSDHTIVRWMREVPNRRPTMHGRRMPEWKGKKRGGAARD